MAIVIGTIWKALAWTKREALISAPLVMRTLRCWLGGCFIGVRRLASHATRLTAFRARARRVDRIEQQLASLCNALAMLTNSIESGSGDATSGLERLPGGAPAPAERPEMAEPSVALGPNPGQTARDIAIAEGVSEGEVRLRIWLQKEMTCQAVSTAH